MNQDDDSDAACFGRLVRAKRTERGWSLEALAGAALSNSDRRGYVSRIENGKVPNVTRNTVRNIARALQIDPEEIPLSLRWPEATAVVRDTNTVAQEIQTDIGKLQATVDRFSAALEINPNNIAQLRDGAKKSWPEKCAPGVGLDRYVVGRERDVNLINKTLDLSRSGTNILGTVIKGQPGIGKTTLAKLYVDRFSHLYRGIWWLRAEKQQTIIDDFCELAQVFGIVESGAGREALARASLVYLQSQPGPWLLVFDNAESLSTIRRWRPTSGDVRVIITSREGNWPGQYQIQQTDRLTLSDATDLIMQEAHRDDDRDGAEFLAEALDGLPLALVNAGAWLRDTPRTSFAEYREQLRVRLRDNPITVDDYAESVYGAVSLSFDRLSAEAHTVLSIIAFLSPDNIDPELLFNLRNKERNADRYLPITDAVWSLCREPSFVEHAFAELERFSLIDRWDKNWRVHRLVQMIKRTSLSDYDNSWNLTAAIIAASFPGKEPNSKTGVKVSDASQWISCKKLIPHIDHLRSLSYRSIESSSFEYLLNQAGIYLAYKINKKTAAQYSIEYLRRKKDRLEYTDPKIGTGYHNLAFRFTSIGKHRWALSSAKKAVQNAENNNEVEDKIRASRINSYGLRMIYYAKTNPSCNELLLEARKEIHKAIKISRSLKPVNYAQLSFCCNNLGLMYENLKKYTHASRMFRVACGFSRKSLPEKSAERPIHITNLGRCLLKEKKFDEARVLLREGLSIREEIYADNMEHPVRLTNAKWLAALELICGNLKDVSKIIEDYAGIIDMNEVREKAELIVNA